MVFYLVPAVADDYIINNIVNGCGEAQFYKAEFEPVVYNCPVGNFLPAGAVSCEQCPVNHVCNGGTYTFSQTETQGLSDGDILVVNATGSCSTNFSQTFSAVFEPISYTCNAGYYLPANGIACAKCLNDNYCLGGTFVFSETNNQGLTPCPAAHPYAPIGMWNELQCGRKLHVGNDVMYLHQSPANPTLHRLFVSFDNKVYSANMVEKQVGIEDPKMSVGVDHAMHVKFNGVEYLVHDDSIE